MTGKRVVAVYTPVLLRPLKFVLHFRQAAGPEVFERHSFISLKDLIRTLLLQLATTRVDFWDRLEAMDDHDFQQSPHKMRRYVADRKDLLYINSPHLTEQHSMKIHGRWIATNIGRKEARGIIQMACEAAGVIRLSLGQLTL
jgi:hypothetical protein